MDNDVLSLADLHETAGSVDNEGFLDKASNWVSKGIPLAVGSGLYSMYNTGVALGNVFGADWEKADFGGAVSDFDNDLSQYYKQHQEGVDLGGFLATSLVPGTVGLKALKMVQSGVLGTNAARVAGFFKNSQLAFETRALDKIRNTSNVVFDALDKDKLVGMAAGFGEQALQGAAFETAVLLSMNQSPILSKTDQSYFSSFLANSHEILTAAAFTAGIGGSLEALGIAGKLRSAIQKRDIEQFPSIRRQVLGESNIDNGTALAIDFSYWQNDLKQFATEKEAGNLSDVQIRNYERSLLNQQQNLQKRITETLTVDKDGALSNQIWDTLINAEDAGEVASTIFSAATKAERIGTDFVPASEIGPKISFKDSYLPPRLAENILKRGKIAPEVLENPQESDLTNLAAQKFELWKDPSGGLHVLEQSDYAKRELQKAGAFIKHNLVVKLGSDLKGQITENAYPVLGDLGDVSLRLKDGAILLNKVERDIPEIYDPLKNDPLTSSSQFLKQRLLGEAKAKGAKFEEPGVEPEAEDIFNISEGNLPALERAARIGGDEVLYGGEDITGNVLETLENEKQALRQKLMEAGHDFRQIARELNTSQEWAETGSGDGLMLSELEDHTKPMHAALEYNTNLLPNNFKVRGVATLMQRVKMGYDFNQKVASFVLKDAYDQLPKSNGTLFNVTTIPRFSTLLTSSSENYGSFGSFMQQAGKVVNSLIRKRATETFESLQAVEHQVRQSPEALAELNIVVQKIRSAKEPLYHFELPQMGTDMVDNYFVPKKIYKALQEEGADPKEILSPAMKDGSAFQIKNKAVEDYILANQARNAERIAEWNNIFSAKGISKLYDEKQVYLPPINTRRYPFVAFIKEKMDLGPGDLKEYGVVSAPSQADLEAKINALKSSYGDRFEIFTSGDVATYKRIQGEYESGPLLGDSLTDQAMRREGLLYDPIPRTDDQIITDINNWHWQQEQGIVRQSVELTYAQEFAELRQMGEQFTKYAKSKFGDKKTASMDNPYQRYINTGLDLSNWDRYNSVWGKLNDSTEKIAGKMMGAWQNAFSRASAGEVDWEKANQIAESYGFVAPYKGLLREVVNPPIDNPRALEPLIAKANSIVSTLTLGLDFLNSVVNVMSFPITAMAEVRSVLKNIDDPTVVGKLKDMTSVVLPDGSVQPKLMPTPMKLLSKAIENFVSDIGNGKKLMERYQSIGAVSTDLKQFQTVVSQTAIPQSATQSLEGFASHVNDLYKTVTDLGKKLTLHDRAEQMVRFLAADMMRQMTDAAGIAESEASSYINAFVNRVHGNYLANQRPQLFQGVLGQAISLFQTYQFNVMQNMVRYVGMGDKAAAATFLGLQNAIFGLQGNPAFYLMNKAIGDATQDHIDIPTAAERLVGRDTAKWLIYGLGSNALQTSLYNRGDLTPRYVTVVPARIEDIPAVAITAKTIGNFIDTASKIARGGDIQQTLLDGLSHNGFNRPLAGLAQLTSGVRTTNKGNLLTAYNDLDAMTVGAKLLGGEEINRAIAIDSYYRTMAYKQADQEKQNQLGEALKTQMYKGQMPSEETTKKFMTEYVNNGGVPRNFNRWFTQNFKSANQSQLNLLKSHVNSPYGLLQGELMGADTQDYWQSPNRVEEN